MQLVNEYQLIYSENNMPILKVVNQHFINDEDEFEGCPEDFLSLVEVWFPSYTSYDKTAYVFSIDADYNITGVFRIFCKNKKNSNRVAKEIFRRLLLIGAEEYVVLYYDPNLEYRNFRFDYDDKKNMSYLSRTGNLFDMKMMCYLVFDELHVRYSFSN